MKWTQKVRHDESLVFHVFLFMPESLKSRPGMIVGSTEVVVLTSLVTVTAKKHFDYNNMHTLTHYTDINILSGGGQTDEVLTGISVVMETALAGEGEGVGEGCSIGKCLIKK